MSRNALYFSFITPPNTGGDFIAIDHIAALNRLGFDAKALYLRNDLGYLNFPVPAVPGSLRLNQNDIIIIAETHKHIFEQVRSMDCVKVLNNQNPFYTFHSFDSVQQLNEYPFAHIVTLSGYTKKLLHQLGVAKPILVVRPCIPSYFSPSEKRLQIAYTTYKRVSEPSFVVESFDQNSPNWRMFRGCHC